MKRKLPPVRPMRARKGNYPANPYAGERLRRHEDRKGWPFPASPEQRTAMVHKATKDSAGG